MKVRAKVLGMASLLVLGACATAPNPSTTATSEAFGSAVKHNIRVHAVAPTQEQKQNTYIPADRSRQDLARKRYREDDVEAPEGVNTSETGG